LQLIYERTLNYLKGLQQNNGQIILDNQTIFNVWETIQAARAISLWQNETDPMYQKKEDIFCTAQILIFLHEFINKK